MYIYCYYVVEVLAGVFGKEKFGECIDPEMFGLENHAQLTEFPKLPPTKLNDTWCYAVCH